VVDVDRRWIVGQGREEDIVHIRHRPADLMDEVSPNLELLEIKASHDVLRSFKRPRIETTATLLNGAQPKL
jgi:hypothetical protein